MATASYTLHLRAGRSPVLVAEGGSFWAALLGPVWLAAHGLWLVLVLWLAAAIGAAVLVALYEPAGIAAAAALCLATGAFARDFQRFTLGLRGYRQDGVVVAPDADAALARALDRDPALASRAFAAASIRA